MDTNIQAMEAQLQSRITQVIEMNRQFTEINDKINSSYRLFNALYGQLHYNSDFQVERRVQLKSNHHQAPLLTNRTKVDNHCTLIFNIFFKYNLNTFI